MAKIKTSELTGVALDWAVAKCRGFNDYVPKRDNYSTCWNKGGSIIERECVCTYASGACSAAPKNPDHWVAEILETDRVRTEYGPTPLIAAMRCYVASKLGDEIEVPDELIK